MNEHLQCLPAGVFRPRIWARSMIALPIYAVSANRLPIRTRLKAAVAISAQSWLRLGVTGIICCVSPAVLFLLGISTAAEAVTLGDRLYYGYAWYFRGADLLLAAAATILYLRRRRTCSVAGAAAHWRTLLSVSVTMVVTIALRSRSVSLTSNTHT